MKVTVEAKPLHEPLAGGTQGATVTVEPLIAGTVDFPRSMMVSPGGPFLTLKLLKALLTGNCPKSGRARTPLRQRSIATRSDRILHAELLLGGRAGIACAAHLEPPAPNAIVRIVRII